MATVTPNQEDEEQGQSNPSQNGQGQSSPSPVASTAPSTTGSSPGPSGGGSKSSGGPSQSQSSYNPSAPTSSGNFTNLKSYLNANNNGKDFSNQVNQNLQQQGSNLNTNIQGASNQFNNQVQQSVTPVQQNYQAYQQVAASNDPNSIVNYANQGNNAKNIQGLENATYTGPKTLNDLSGNYNGAALQSQVGNYQNLANDTTSESGRMNLLQSLYGNQNYGQGQQTLDNVFLQGNNFGNTASQANRLNNSYNTAANNSALSAQNAANTVNQAATGTVNSLNAAVGNQNQNIQNDYSSALQNQAAQNAAATTALQNGTISQQLATQLGLTGGTNLYNVDASQFLHNAQLNTQNTATGQDYSNIAALHNLLGNNANTGSSQILSQYASQPGSTMNPNQYLNYDTSGLQNASQIAGQTYNDLANADVANLNQGYVTGPSIGSLISNPNNLTSGSSNQDLLNQYLSDATNTGANNSNWSSKYGDASISHGQLSALQNLINANSTYDPTKQLQIAPNENT